MIYAAADLHICRFVWQSRKDMEGDSFRALAAMGDMILRDEVPAGEKKTVLLAGDLFDAKKVDGPTLEAFTKFVDDMYDADIPVYFTQGNHEFNPVMPIAAVQGATSLEGAPITVDGRIVKGLDYRPPTELKEALASIGACDILVLHCGMEHLVSYAPAADISIADLPATVKHVVVGDIHVSHKLPLPSGGFCVSPGPLHPCTVTQGGPKGFFKIGASESDWTFVDIGSRDVLRFEILTEGDWDVALERIASKTGPSPIIELKYTGDVAEQVSAWVAENGSKFSIFEYTIPNEIEMEVPCAEGEELSLCNVLPYVLPEGDALALAQALVNNPDDAERLVGNKIEEIRNDTAN